MYRPYLVLLILLIFSNCSGKNEIPEDILSKGKMEEVIWDMIRADEFVAFFIWKNDSAINRLAESSQLYDQVFSIHGITKVRFQKSLAFYRNHPDQLKIIIDSLNAKENLLKGKNPVKLSEDSGLIRNKILPIQ